LVLRALAKVVQSFKKENAIIFEIGQLYWIRSIGLHEKFIVGIYFGLSTLNIVVFVDIDFIDVFVAAYIQMDFFIMVMVWILANMAAPIFNFVDTFNLHECCSVAKSNLSYEFD